MGRLDKVAASFHSERALMPSELIVDFEFVALDRNAKSIGSRCYNVSAPFAAARGGSNVETQRAK
jgi:hypothetical protein